MRDEVFRPVALEIEQGGQVAMVDAGRASAATIGLARNATPSPAALQHGESLAPSPTAMISPRPMPARTASLLHRLQLGVLAQDRLGDARKRAVFEEEAVAVIDIEAGAFGDHGR